MYRIQKTVFLIFNIIRHFFSIIKPNDLIYSATKLYADIRETKMQQLFVLFSRELGADSKKDNKSNHRPTSPTGKMTPIAAREPGSLCASKPSHLTPSPAPSVSPGLKKTRAEAGLKAIVPTILVEHEPVEEERRRREGRAHKSTKARSPEDGRSSFMSTNHKLSSKLVQQA